jgi:DNA polymerase/3'-5' exonuclease PolX
MNKSVFSLRRAQGAAQNLVNLLQPACRQIEIAGSIRRRKAEVHDIDLVVWPYVDRYPETDLFGNEVKVTIEPRRLMDLLEKKGLGEMKPAAKIVKFQWGGIPAELYICEPDGSNFQALLQMRTGSAEFNANLASRAKRMNLKYVAGYGIFRETERVDDGTEAGIFVALGLPWTDPPARDWRLPENVPMETEGK